MKRTVLLTLFLAFSLAAFAQSNFYKISVGAGAGITQPFTEVKKHDLGLAGYGTLDYLFTPFFSMGAELQKGDINGGDYQTDPLSRQFVNSYLSFAFNTKISLGEFIDNNYSRPSSLFKGLYIGGGIGTIKNKALRILRYEEDNPGLIYSSEVASTDIFFPLNLGINFYFPDREGFYRYVLNFNYQANITLGEGLDGYDDTRINFKSGTPDIFTFFSAGLKYNFGKIGLSRKTFRSY